MASREQELRRWLDDLHASAANNPQHRALHDAAVLLLEAIERCAPSEYREMALCKLTDLIPLGFIAGRQTNQGEPP